MEKYIEKQLRRYVIATLDSPAQYLLVEDGEVSFTNDIIKCTKAVSKRTAEYMRNLFYEKTRQTDIELVVIPLVITYELICEDEIIEIQSNGQCCALNRDDAVLEYEITTARDDEIVS